MGQAGIKMDLGKVSGLWHACAKLLVNHSRGCCFLACQGPMTQKLAWNESEKWIMVVDGNVH